MTPAKKTQTKLSFNEAKELVRVFKIFTAKEYLRFRAASDEFKLILPNQPSVFYKNDWKGWCDFTGFNSAIENDVDIQKIQKLALSLDIRTKEEWRLAVATNLINGPLHISKVEGFSNWAQFLAKDKYFTFKDLLTFTRPLGLKTQTDWRQWCKRNKRPDQVPFDLAGHYKEDFLKIEPSIKVSFWRYLFIGEVGE